MGVGVGGGATNKGDGEGACSGKFMGVLRVIAFVASKLTHLSACRSPKFPWGVGFVIIFKRLVLK